MRQLPTGCFAVLWISQNHSHMEALLTNIDIPFTFRQRPAPLTVTAARVAAGSRLGDAAAFAREEGDASEAACSETRRAAP